MWRSWAISVVLLLGLFLPGCPTTADDDAGDDDTGDDDAGDDDAGDDDAGDDDAGDDDAADDDVGDDDTGPSGPATLRNSPQYCYEPSYLYPAEDEVGHWAAARLEPAAWPFTVERIRYRLEVGVNQDVSCKPNLEHRVWVTIAVDETPPAANFALSEYTIPAIADALGVRTVEHDLDPPRVLTEGAGLVVAVEMVGSYPEVSCLALCFDDPVVADGSWWSQATGEPYAWATLPSLGIDGNLSVEADGAY